MENNNKNLFQPAIAITLSFYIYALVVSIFLSFSLSAWLFGFVITRLGSGIEYFLLKGDMSGLISKLAAIRFITLCPTYC